jgi:hypothetical protein
MFGAISVSQFNDLEQFKARAISSKDSAHCSSQFCQVICLVLINNEMIIHHYNCHDDRY